MVVSGGAVNSYERGITEVEADVVSAVAHVPRPCCFLLSDFGFGLSFVVCRLLFFVFRSVFFRLRVSGSEFRFSRNLRFVFRIACFGFSVQSFAIRVSGSDFWNLSFVFRVQVLQIVTKNLNLEGLPP